MLHRDFPAFEGRIAVGVAGEGSDCFGFDDEISRDHDFGTGVCLWVRDEDQERMGHELRDAYRQTLQDWQRKEERLKGKTGGDCTRLNQRRGVQTIREFYSGILGLRIDPARPALTDGAWFYTEEWKFATAVNGEIFRDDSGEFSRVREMLLSYYPDRVWRMRLANALHDYAASVQANYARCMARRDMVAAEYCRVRGIDAAMNILFLLRRTYAPYYKWKFRAFRDLTGSGELAELLLEAAAWSADPEAWRDYTYDSHKVNSNDRLIMLFEQIAEEIVRELRREGLTDSDNPFLEAHCAAVSRRG